MYYLDPGGSLRLDELICYPGLPDNKPGEEPKPHHGHAKRAELMLWERIDQVDNGQHWYVVDEDECQEKICHVS